MNLFEKLSRVQQKLKAPKNQYNDYGGYHYRSCEDVVEAVKPLLADEGLVMTISDELVQIGDRYYIKATVSVYDPENDAEHRVEGYAREEENKKGMDSMQLTGATSSYARKYALNGMFAIDDTKDADATNDHGRNSNNKKGNKKRTGTKKSYIAKIREEFKKNKEELKPLTLNYLSSIGYEELSDVKKLNNEQAKNLYKQIKEAK